MKSTRDNVQKTKEKSSELERMRHTTAHVLAAGVLELYPNTKLGIGPVIENGFYYDFDFKDPISSDDLPKIEKEMHRIVKENREMQKFVRDRQEALEIVRREKQSYKEELIHDLPESAEISFYDLDGFVDLCAGPHAESSDKLGAFKLTHVAGAYWKGSEKNKMLTRIYGVAFHTQKELDDYLALVEEAKKRDHKKLGQELDLFTFSDLVGAGLPLWTPKGTILRELLDDYVWSLRALIGYEKVEIPHITKKDLYEKSGHWDKFKDELFRIKTREGHEFAMKPMNCPHHTQIFKRKMWSYRDLPQRYANTTMCYRDEQTGELNGLSRVRAFTQDDAHVFARSDQVTDEMDKIWQIIETFYQTFDFDLRIRLSFWDPEHKERYLGDQKVWEKAQGEIQKLAEAKKADFSIAPGEAAFYGPKIDFMAKDSLGREWQVATIQLDMNMPERFDLTYINEKGEADHVVMIHAAIMGSIERFVSILIEHFAGAFPVWLAPEQVVIVPISEEKHGEYAQTVQDELGKFGVRVRVDNRNETLGKRIRENQMQKIPYIVIVGDKEVLDKTVAIRHITDGDRGAKPLQVFIDELRQEIAEKR